MKMKKKRVDPKPMEFAISHTPRGKNSPGLDFYRIQMGSYWENELRTRLNATVSQLEARLVFYSTDNVFDLVVRKSPFVSKTDKAHQTGGRSYAWAGEGRQPGAGKSKHFLSFVMQDDKVIDYNATEVLLLQGKAPKDFKYYPTFSQFAVTRLTPTIADFSPRETLWADEYGGNMVCLTFSMASTLKAPSTRERRSAEEMKVAAKQARSAIANMERPTTGAKQLKLPLVADTPQTIQDRLRDRFMELKALIGEATGEDLLVSLEGSGEDVAMTVERIERTQVVYR